LSNNFYLLFGHNNIDRLIDFLIPRNSTDDLATFHV
jgi:hypothetical protein